MWNRPGYEAILDQLTTDDVVRVAAPTLVETSVVLVARVCIVGKTLLARLLEETEAEVIDFADEHRDAAVQAFITYGKGRHPAGLNFGDCLTYAVARLSGERLLCVGEDLPLADVPLVVGNGSGATSQYAHREQGLSDVPCWSPGA